MTHDEPSTAPSSIPRRIFEAHALEAIERMRTAGLITHPGELGRAREEILRQFLAEIVPTGFDVATGFVIDTLGGQSRQQDLIIVRRDYHPKFQVGGAQFFPVEAVAATIEVKSTLNKQSLLDAIENVMSVKRLDRTARAHNYVVLGGPGGGQIEGAWEDKDRTELKSFIVAASSDVYWNTSYNTFHDAVQGESRSVWPNSVAVAGAFYLAYKGPEGSPRTDVHAAQQMAAYLPDEETNVEPLVDLAGDLWSWLRVAPLIDVAPLLYVPTSDCHKLGPMPDASR